MAKFASDTTVSVSASQTELERTLERYGATSFMRGWDKDKAVIVFSLKDRRMRFILTLPEKKDFRYTPARGFERSEAEQTKAWEQACRQRWRALNLVVKAKLEAVEAGISTIEEEFLANIFLPNGDTVGQWIAPQVAEAYRTGVMPPMLPSGR